MTIQKLQISPTIAERLPPVLSEVWTSVVAIALSPVVLLLVIFRPDQFESDEF